MYLCLVKNVSQMFPVDDDHYFDHPQSTTKQISNNFIDGFTIYPQIVILVLGMDPDSSATD